MEFDEMKNHAINFFTKIYSSSRDTLSIFLVCNCFPSIFEEALNMLASNVFKDEIYWALFDMKPFKAPGVDGLHASFFQT